MDDTMVPQGAPDGLPGYEDAITPWGKLPVRHFGDKQGPPLICVHGAEDTDETRNAFNNVAIKLGMKGWHVMVPNFHAAPAELQAGKMYGHIFIELVLGTLVHLND